MKKLKYLIFILLTFLSCNNFVYADSISISSNKKSIVVGNSVTISSTVTSNSPLVSIEGTLSCSGAGTGGGIDLGYKLRRSAFDILNLGSQGIVKWAFLTGNLMFLFEVQTEEIKDHIGGSCNHRHE